MQNQHFNIYFWLRKRTIYCYFTIGKQKCVDFSTGIKCNPTEWNQDLQLSTTFYLQREIEKIKNKIFEIKNGMDLAEQNYSPESLKDMYLNSAKPPVLLFHVYEQLIEHKRKQEKEFRTVQTYITRKNNMQEYLKFLKNEKIAINDVDMAFTERFKDYLITQKYASVYINKNIQALGSVIKHAHRLGHIKDNPLLYVEYLPTKAKPKIYLTLTELADLENFNVVQPSLQRVKDLFLWQCYTGMDYSTMKEFKAEFIKSHQTTLYIEGFREKTGSRYVLPLFDKAQTIWQKYGNSLPLISLQKYNTYLKNVIEMVGISKNITTHSGRKTFANFWESKGLDRRTIADMLGHQKIDITLKHYSDIQIDGILKKMG
ncbi:MAG: site-specific integrase [Bacteroidetes bacterium]|nr:MAG: site-specific integrase [Bacteroidota bacterium]